MAYATTDREGRFAFRGLNAPPCDLRVSPGDIGTSASEPFTIQAGSTIEGLQLHVAKSGVVEGTARDAEGQPIPGACVWLRNVDVASGQQIDGSVYEVLTDRQGRFRHIGVEPGGHALQLFVGEDRSGGYSCDPFEVEPVATVAIDLRDDR